MFLKFALALVISALVPILGLTSCSKDRTDDWSLSEPTLTAGTISYPARTANHRTFPFATVMRFGRAEWSSLKVDASCTIRGETFIDSFSLSPREALELKSLWPRKLTARFGDSDLRQSSCDFKFMAANSEGSTHDFSISGIKLETFIDTKEPLLIRQALDRASTVRTLSVKAEMDYLARVTSELVDSIDARAAIKLSLICDGESGQIDDLDPDIPLREAMQKLAYTGERLCHFLASEAEAETNRFALSADVPMRFSNLVLPVSNRSLMPSAFAQQTLLEVRIENPNPEEAFVRVPQVVPETRGRLAYLTSQDALVMSPRELKSPMTASVAGARVVHDDVYAIAPRSAITIQFVQQNGFARQCLRPTLETGAPPAIGLRWGFVSGYAIQQLDTPDESGPSIFSVPVISNSYSYPASVLDDRYTERFGPMLPASTPTAAVLMPSGNCF